MNVRIEIHSSWLRQPDLLKRMLTACAALEAPAPAEPGNGNAAPAENHRPEPRRAAPDPPPDRGDAYEEDLDDQEEQEKPPENGRQLLGWASKQRPDAKSEIMGFGKRKGYPSKIVTWNADMVRNAYHHVRNARR
jgi:hypothetical protein